MKLNHLNLTVTNVPVAHQFLEKYFGLHDQGGNNNMAFLSDDNGLVLSLTSMKVGRETEVKYPSTFHIGFIQANEEQGQRDQPATERGRLRCPTPVQAARFLDLLLPGPRWLHDRGSLLIGSRQGRMLHQVS